MVVAQLHFTADPAKRDPAWKEQAKAGMPDRGWAREYELSFDAPAGDAVFPEWTAAHIRPIRPLTDTRILRGWDFGGTAPAVGFAPTDPWGRLLVHPRCVTLIEAMAGAFHYPERPSMRDPRPVPTHPYKDLVDALR